MEQKISLDGNSYHAMLNNEPQTTDYLNKTAQKHHIFGDLHNISTLLIPRSDLPPLPEKISLKLGYYFSASY